MISIGPFLSFGSKNLIEILVTLTGTTSPLTI
jgi:hypothetical protein